MYTQPNLRILYNSVNWGWRAILISLKLISHKNGFGKDILPEIILSSIILNFLGLYISFSLLAWITTHSAQAYLIFPLFYEEDLFNILPMGRINPSYSNVASWYSSCCYHYLATSNFPELQYMHSLSLLS